MAINAFHFEAHIVRPALNQIAKFDPRLASESAVKLMMGTAAQESHLSYWLRQHPTGPGKGPWSVEDATHEDVWRYLGRESNADLALRVLGLARHKTARPPHTELTNNPLYSCAIARIKYWMIPSPLPETIEDQADYWDCFYNCNPDHGTPEEYLANYKKFISEH